MDAEEPRDDIHHEADQDDDDDTPDNVAQARQLAENMTGLQIRLVVFAIQRSMQTFSPMSNKKKPLLEYVSQTLEMSPELAVDAVNLVHRAMNGEDDDEDEDEDEEDEDHEQHIQHDEDSGVAGGDQDDDDDEEIEIEDDDDDDDDDMELDGDNEGTPALTHDDQKGGFEDDDDDDDDVDVERDLDPIDGVGEDDDDDDDIDVEIPDDGAADGHGGAEDDGEDHEGYDSRPGPDENSGQVNTEDDQAVIVDEDEDDDEDDDLAQGPSNDSDQRRGGDTEIAEDEGPVDGDHDDDDVGLDLDNIPVVGVVGAAPENGTGGVGDLDVNLNVVGDHDGEVLDAVGNAADDEGDEDATPGSRKRRRSLFDGGEQPPVRQMPRHSSY